MTNNKDDEESQYFVKKFKEALIELSVSKDFNIAKDEWIILHKHTFEKSNCICTHDIIENHHIKNIYNKKTAIIGSKCIRHISNELYELTKKEDSIENRLMKDPEYCLKLQEPDLKILHEYCKCIDYFEYRFYTSKTKEERINLYNSYDSSLCSIIIKIYDYFESNKLIENYCRELKNKLKTFINLEREKERAILQKRIRINKIKDIINNITNSKLLKDLSGSTIYYLTNNTDLFKEKSLMYRQIKFELFKNNFINHLESNIQ